MANAARSFSAQATTFFFGPVIASGFGPDDIVTIEPSNDAWTPEIGADGDLSFYQKPVFYTITVTLSQTSKANDAMSGIHIADKTYGTGVLPCGFKDNRGTSLCALTAARILSEPSAAFGTTAKTREWKIAGVGENFIGGN